MPIRIIMKWKNCTGLLLIFVLISCQKLESSYQNKNQSLVLKLYADSTYSYFYPTFFREIEEKGEYELQEDKIILTREETNTFSDIYVRYTCSEENPDSLLISTKDFHEKRVDTKFYINDSPEVFQAASGEIKISYEALEAKGIVKEDRRISSFIFFYNGKEYVQSLVDYYDSRIPDYLDFRLNQFKGERNVILKREYLLEKDSIHTNDISGKIIGIYNNILSRQNTVD